MNILLGVTGSISAYKTFDILRGLISNGHEVSVILTNGALEFVRPELFKYLGAKKILLPNSSFNPNFESSDQQMIHIEITRWADKFVIVPASANTIANLANGNANDLLTATFLAWESQKPIIIFPAMNTKMLNHQFTCRNMETLNTLPNLFVHPTIQGSLACGDIGFGKLPEVEKIIELIPVLSNIKTSYSKKILIVTGATISPLDPVRYLTNSSSGITGFHLAKEALNLGHTVHVIAGHNATTKLNYFTSHPNYTIEKTKTNQEMFQAVKESIATSDIYLSAAAIGDINFPEHAEKIKKDNLMESLPIESATDILSYVLKTKKDHQQIVGFAAETNLSPEVLNKKWKNKPVDLLVGTKVHNGFINNQKQEGFSEHDATYSILKEGNLHFDGKMTKDELSTYIFGNIAQ